LVLENLENYVWKPKNFSRKTKRIDGGKTTKFHRVNPRALTQLKATLYRKIGMYIQTKDIWEEIDQILDPFQEEDFVVLTHFKEITPPPFGSNWKGENILE